LLKDLTLTLMDPLDFEHSRDNDTHKTASSPALLKDLTLTLMDPLDFEHSRENDTHITASSPALSMDLSYFNGPM